MSQLSLDPPVASQQDPGGRNPDARGQPTGSKRAYLLHLQWFLLCGTPGDLRKEALHHSSVGLWNPG